MTLHELQAALEGKGRRFGIGTLWRFFERRKVTFKKSLFASEQQRPDILKRRREWFEGQLDPGRLIFIDETWASTNMTRLRGRAPRGERLKAFVPYGHWKTTTLVAGLRLTGVDAPMVLDGPINREAFTAYVIQILCPSLKPGDIVIMDNLSSHKSPLIAALIAGRGARLHYLPPYSPDFTPIENAFAEIKSDLRAAAQRTLEELWQTIATSTAAITPQACRNYLAHTGYDAW